MQFHKRSPVSVLLLTWFTCGIYELILIFQITAEIRDYRKNASVNPGLELLLCIITCGFYHIYWFYRYGSHVTEMQKNLSLPYSDTAPAILMIIDILGFGIISLMMLQTELNRVWDAAASGRSAGDTQ